MEKILLAVEGNQQSAYAIDFACYLAKLTGSRLTGVFLEGDPDGEGQEVMRGEGRELLHLDGPAIAGCTLVKMPCGDPVIQQMDRFREACLSREVTARVHRDRGVPFEEMILESRFSDLIVIDPETSFQKGERASGGHFIQEVLPAAECPVVVSPYRFERMDEVIFAYDGSASSVYAIKQFTYLFPMFKNKKAVMVNVNREERSAMVEQFKMKEWLSAHYQDVSFVILNGSASDELLGYLLGKKDAIAVLGAYGRGILSRFLKPSHASLLLRTINLPVFIAHH